MGLCASAPKADRDPKPQSETTQSLPVDTKCSATEQSRPRVDNGVCSDSHTYTDVSNVKLTFLQGEQVVHSIHEEEHEAAPHNSEMCSPHTASEPTASEPAESPLLPLAQLKDSTNPPGASLAQFDPRAGDEDSSPTEPSSKDSEQNRERFQDPRQSHDASRSLISGADLVGDGLDSNFRETSTLKKVMVSGKMMLNQYMVIKTLGKGNFGTVRLCFNLNDKKLYAIKTLNKKTLTKNRGLKKRKDADPLADLKREVAIMKKLRHPNLVRLFEVIDDPLSTKLLMVMEHVQGGPIRSDKPGAPGCMAEQVVVHYFRDMCMGLDYLHFNQIVHADLKPENMLLSATGEVKITDFGCSRVLDEEGIVPSRATGTPMFHAPEMTTGQPYNAYMADVWALGVTLYAFIFGEMPFDGKSIAEIHYNIANKALEFSASYFVSDELKDLLLRMMEKDPAKRIRLPEIMAHSWVTQGGTATINSLQYLQNPPPVLMLESDAEESDAIRSDTFVALMQPEFEEVIFKDGDHLIRAGEKHDVVFYLCSGQCEVVQMVSSMRPQVGSDEATSREAPASTNDTQESTMFTNDDWSCYSVANPNSSVVQDMYQSLDKLQVVHFEHVVRTLSPGSFVGNVPELEIMEYFSDNVSVVAKGEVSALVIEKKDLMHFLASRPEVEKVIRGRMAQAKTEKLVYNTVKQFSREIGKPSEQ